MRNRKDFVHDTDQPSQLMSVILLLPAVALSAVTGLDVLISVALMGIEAVLWTDVLQCVVLIGGEFLALAIMIVDLDGNWGAFVTSNQEYGKLASLLWG